MCRSVWRIGDACRSGCSISSRCIYIYGIYVHRPTSPSKKVVWPLAPGCSPLSANNQKVLRFRWFLPQQDSHGYIIHPFTMHFLTNSVFCSYEQIIIFLYLQKLCYPPEHNCLLSSILQSDPLVYSSLPVVYEITHCLFGRD